MKVLHITPSFYPANYYGGTISSGLGLSRALIRNGAEVRVLTTDANGLNAVLPVVSGREVEISKGLYVAYCRRLVRHSVSPMLLRLLPRYVQWADVIHLTAVYSFPTFPTLLACNVLNRPLMWSPRGALQRWEGSRRRTLKAMWEKACWAMAPRRLIFHATSEDEARESQQRIPGIECVVIPNGVDIPEKARHAPKHECFRLLYLGRLHQKKGVENLLLACKQLENNPSFHWSLTIAGGGDPHYTQTIRLRIGALGLSKHVTMVGAVNGEAKERLFEHTDMAIVPSFTENFGIVVAESLAYGVPVIASKGTPWRCLEEVGCGLWVDNDPESLAHAILCMSQMPLREMGQRGRELMQREFSWDIMAEKMIRTYRTLLVASRIT